MSDTAAEPLLSLDRVSVRYGRTRVVDDVSIQLAPGAVLALLGRNGSGKSSLVRCLLGHQRPAAGQVRLFGRSAWSNRTRAMARIGVVPEDPDAPSDMSAASLLALCRKLYPRWDAAYVDALLERSGVPRQTAFGHLSKGQKGAVMLALALGHAPELLVLDDPTLGLDAVARRALYGEIIGALADRGTAVLITSHDLSGIEPLADRVAILDDHRMLLNEPLEQLKARYRSIRVTGPAAQSGIDWHPFETLRSTTREWGAESLVSNFSEQAFAAFRSRAGTDGAEVLSLSLEDIFIALTGAKEAVS